MRSKDKREHIRRTNLLMGDRVRESFHGPCGTPIGVDKYHQPVQTENDKKDVITFDTAVNLKQLEKFAEGLLLISLGECGYTMINKEEMKIAVSLGDSNPFGSLKELEEWIRWGCLNGSHDFISSFDIEIDTEFTNSGENWKTFRNKKWS